MILCPHHVGPYVSKQQQCERFYVGGQDPDRELGDLLVHAITYSTVRWEIEDRTHLKLDDETPAAAI